MEIYTRFGIALMDAVITEPAFQLNEAWGEISTEPINWLFDENCEEVFVTVDTEEYADIVHDDHVTPIQTIQFGWYKGTTYVDHFDDKKKGVLLIPPSCEPYWEM